MQKHDEITHIFCIKFDSRKDAQTLTETNVFKCEKHFSIIKETRRKLWIILPPLNGTGESIAEELHSY